MTDLKDTLLDAVSAVSDELEQLYDQKAVLDQRISLAHAKLDGINALLTLENQVAELPTPDHVSNSNSDVRSAADISFSFALFTALDNAILRRGEANLDEAYRAVPEDIRERFEAGGPKNSAYFRARRLVRRNSQYTVARGSDTITLAPGQRTRPPAVPFAPPKNPVIISHWTSGKNGTRIHWSDSKKTDNSTFKQLASWMLEKGGVPYVLSGEKLMPVALYREDGAQRMSSYDEAGWNQALASLKRDEKTDAAAS